MLFIAMLIASTLAIAVPNAKAAAGATFRLVATPSTFGPANCVGDTFTVDLMVENATRLYGVDLQIGWDTIYVGYVSHVKHIPRVGSVGILFSPTIGVKDQVDETASMSGSAPGTMYWLAEAAMLPALNFNGTGSAATLTMQIKKQGMPGEPDVTTFITITDSTLANDGGNPVDHDRIDAEITIISRTLVYPPNPLLKIMPELVENVKSGETFDSDIMLAAWDGSSVVDLDPFWDVAGFDMTYTFDPTLIQATTSTIDPDGWFAAFWPNGILVVKNEIDNVAGTVWIVFLGIPGDFGIHTAPFGQGTLATITFTSIYDSTTYPPEQCDLTLIDTTVAGFPHPERAYAPWFGSDTAVPLEHFVQNGLYISYFKPMGRNIDLYTCQYPAGFNGAGPNVPADMVWPQKGLWLCANVTYSLWPTQQKDVAFQVMDPHSQIWGIFYGRTDANGHVCVFFRLPWPCDNPEYYFGKWKVIATVDIACQVVNDTMEFKYDYRVRIWKTTLDAASYKHGEYIHVTIDYGTYSDQTFDALFTVTACDEVGVPFGFGYKWETVGGQHEWCTYINGTTEIDIFIPKFAVAGIGTIYVGVLSGWPLWGGSAYYPTRRPETIVDFGIEAA